MNIKIIAVGKIREKFIKAGVEEFIKRIQPYSSLKVIEINAENIRENDNSNKSAEIEGDKILNNISEGAFVVTMEINGKQLSSEQFAGEIKRINNQGINQMVFVIGGAIGLSDKVLKRSDLALSLSKMTLPHQMARFFLLEQIYRAFKINKNEPYHK